MVSHRGDIGQYDMERYVKHWSVEWEEQYEGGQGKDGEKESEKTYSHPSDSIWKISKQQYDKDDLNRQNDQMFSHRLIYAPPL